MNFIDWHGELFYHHNINFPEEITFMADDPLLVVFASESIINEQFIKFFREKYRLCWKEIYLKLSVVLYQTEKCKLCRQTFQISQLMECKENPKYFHEIDFEDKETWGQNQFTEHEFEVFKKQIQVIENSPSVKVEDVMRLNP